MDIYVNREIELSKLLGTELPSDIQELLEYFKSLTVNYSKNEDGLEIWTDKDGQWTIEICEEKLDYTRIYYKKWDFLSKKYELNYDQTRDLIKGMLEVTLNRKVDTPLMEILKD